MGTVFRKLQIEDAPQFRDSMDDDAIRQFTGSIPADPTLAWAEERLRSSDEMGLFTEEGVLLGSCGHFVNKRGEVEIGYSVAPDARGRGVAQKLIAHLLDMIKNSDHSGPLYAAVAKGNPASMHILKKFGFQLVGEDSYESLAQGREIEAWLLRIDDL